MERLRKNDYYVADTSLAFCAPLIRKYHYAKGCSKTAVYLHGLFRAIDSRLVGVAQWLPPTRPAAEQVNKAEWQKVLCLSRLVILPEVPRNGCSFLLGKSMQLIEEDGRFVSLVTFADQSQGHTGAIYRATNWDYVGLTEPMMRWIDPETGRQVSIKATVSRTVKEMESLGYVRDGSHRKHKFVKHFPLKKHSFKLRP